MTVSWLLAHASSRELTEWQVFLAAEADRERQARESAKLEADLEG